MEGEPISTALFLNLKSRCGTRAYPPCHLVLRQRLRPAEASPGNVTGLENELVGKALRNWNKWIFSVEPNANLQNKEYVTPKACDKSSNMFSKVSNNDNGEGVGDCDNTTNDKISNKSLEENNNNFIQPPLPPNKTEETTNAVSKKKVTKAVTRTAVTSNNRVTVGSKQSPTPKQPLSKTIRPTSAAAVRKSLPTPPAKKVPAVRSKVGSSKPAAPTNSTTTSSTVKVLVKVPGVTNVKTKSKVASSKITSKSNAKSPSSESTNYTVEDLIALGAGDSSAPTDEAMLNKLESLVDKITKEISRLESKIQTNNGVVVRSSPKRTGRSPSGGSARNGISGKGSSSKSSPSPLKKKQSAAIRDDLKGHDPELLNEISQAVAARLKEMWKLN